MTPRIISKSGICAVFTIALATFFPPPSNAQNNVPHYEVDPSWPKPLPDRWVTGEMGGVCVDSQDHVFIAQRVSDVGGMDGHLEGLT
ncbi:MAG: repeat containing protein, partial [Candidatus Acidoferrum typicum]|nr:repeat containing protein [Candidatus Acidoferrum typicum]